MRIYLYSCDYYKLICFVNTKGGIFVFYCFMFLLNCLQKHTNLNNYTNPDIIFT